MARVKRVCRVCGKEYEACHTMAPAIDTFRWQEVACSPECGAAYLNAVLEARGEKPVEKKAKAPRKAPANSPAGKEDAREPIDEEAADDADVMQDEVF